MSVLGLSFPLSVPTSPPIRGYGDPNVNGRAGIIGQEYTDLNTGQVYMKGNPSLRELRWFPIGSATGNAAVIYGTSGQISPLGITAQAGPAIWYGTNGAIWVKTDPGNDFLRWYPLTTVPLPVITNGDPLLPVIKFPPDPTDYGSSAYTLKVSSLPNSQGQQLDWTFPAKWVDGVTTVPGTGTNAGTTHWPVYNLTLQRSASSTNNPYVRLGPALDPFPFFGLPFTPHPSIPIPDIDIPTDPDWVNIAQWSNTSVDALPKTYIDPTTPNPNFNYRLIMNNGLFTISGVNLWTQLEWNVASVNNVPSGTATLIQRIKNMANQETVPYAIAADASGNIYVTGSFNSIESFDGGATTYTSDMGGYTPFLVKYRPDGTVDWYRIFYIKAGFVQPTGLCVGSDGNVTIGGSFAGQKPGFDFTTLVEKIAGGVTLTADQFVNNFAFAVQYTPSGSLVFAKSYGPANSLVFSRMVDDGTFTYAVLNFIGVADPGTGVASTHIFNFQVLKIARNGSATVLVNAGADNVDNHQQVFVTSILKDSSGNILLSGTLGGVTDMDGFTTASGGMFMAKYSSVTPHTLIWSPTKVRVYHGPSILGATIEPSGEIIVCGAFTGSFDIGGGTGNKINSGSTSSNLDQTPFIAGYGSDGSWNWQIVFPADGLPVTGNAAASSAFSVIVNGGRIYVHGFSGEPGIVIGDQTVLANHIFNGRLYIVSMTSNGPNTPTINWHYQTTPGGGGAYVYITQVNSLVWGGGSGPVAYGRFGTGCTFVNPSGPNVVLTNAVTSDAFIVRYLP